MFTRSSLDHSLKALLACLLLLQKEAEAEVTHRSPRERVSAAGFSGKVAGKTATRGTIQVGPEEVVILNEFKTGVTSCCSSLSFFRFP